MHPTLYISPLVVSMALTISSSLKAAEPVVLQNKTFNTLQQHFQLVLPGSKTLLKKNNSLHLLQQHTDENKMTHSRVQQKYEGIVVYGGYAILHSPESAKHLFNSPQKLRMNGVLYDGLKADLGSMPDRFIPDGAEALAHFKTLHNEGVQSEDQVLPLVYIDDHNKAHWAYKVSVLVTFTDKIPQRPTAIIDAHSQEPFLQWNDIKQDRVPAKAMGYGGNIKTGEVFYGKKKPLLNITWDKEAEKCYMENPEVRVVDMNHHYSAVNFPMEFHCQLNGIKLADPLFWTGYEGDGYDKTNGAFSPSNDAAYAGQVIKKLYRDWYHMDVLTKYDGQPMQLIMRVHMGLDFENAYWDGRQMTFGDGKNRLYPLATLGIAAHEISHGFTDQNSDLQYYGQSGGLNESFSDMAAIAAEYYMDGKTNWMVGAEVMKQGTGRKAMRYMDVPSRDGHSIDSAADYTFGLDVHYSSGVYNRLFYLMAQQRWWNVHKAFNVMVKANQDYWVPTSNFEEAACGVLHAAKDLRYSTGGIKNALTQVGVNYEQCEGS